MKTLQWYNENRYRRYPLVDDCKLELHGPGTVTLPNDLFLDFQFVSYLLPAGHVRLHSILAGGTSAQIRFEYNNLAEDNPVLFTTILSNLGSVATPYHAVIWTNNTRLQVWLGDAINTWLAYMTGTYVAADKVYMQPALSSYQDRHRVNSLRGDTHESVDIDGDIYVQDGNNVDATVNLDAKTLQFMGMPGAGLGRSTDRVDPSRPGCDDVLLTINGVYGDKAGEFRLKGAKGVIIKPVPEHNELQIQVAVTTDSLKCMKQQQRHQP